MDKQRRKAEAELTVCQEQVADLERDKKEIEMAICKKDSDIVAAQKRLEDDQHNVAKLRKTIKELQARIESGEEELEAERQARSKAEKQKGTLARELDDLTERLDEAGGATNAQIELNKKREAEIGKLRRDLEEAHIQNEALVAGFKKKNCDATAEMSEQVEQLNKMKQKIEDVVTSLIGLLVGHTGFLQQVDVNETSSQFSHMIEVDTDELSLYSCHPSDQFEKKQKTYESGGVVIPDGLGVAVRLQNGVGVDDTILQVGFLLLLHLASFLLRLGGSEDGKV